MRHRLFLVVVLAFCLCLGGLAHAQDASPTDPTPTDVPTDAPVVLPTDVPTDIPTDIPTEAPTDIPTDIPTDVPTDIPTDVPTDVPTDTPIELPTDVPTETTVVSGVPVFSLADGTAFDATAGLSLTVNLSVADDVGIVSVTGVASSAASVQLQITPPVETAAPFNTNVTLVYLSPSDFSGADVVTLTAVNSAGVSVTLAITVNVSLPQATLTPTPEPTALPTKTLLINYNPAASEEAIQALLAELGAVEVKRIPEIGAMQILVPDAISTSKAAIAAVSGTGAAQAAGFSSAEENGTWSSSQDGHSDFIPNDTFWGDSGQWGLKETDPGTWTQLAWDDYPARGLGVVVAVVDSGVWATHPDLSTQILPGYDFINDDADASDDFGHGTHVAGTIAAKTNNALGVAGIAYKAKILPVKVLDSNGNGPWFVIAQGIVYAADKGARVINLSLGGGSYSTTVAGAVNYALTRGVVVIAAAGNSGGTAYSYPASYNGVISVAAHDSLGNHASFSTANDRVTISAPGVDILSTMLTNPSAALNSPSGYGYLDGTSMATPHVSGVAALLISSGVATTPAAVKEALICGSRDINGGGYDNQMGYGVLDADYALRWNGNLSNCHIPQVNDNFENATNIAALPYSVTQAVQSRSATAQISDPSICGTPSQTLWYKYKPTVSGYYQFSTVGSSFDTTLSVYRGTTAGALTYINCNDDWIDPVNGSASLFAAQLVAGQTYYIMVDGFGSGIYDDQVLQLTVRSAIETLNTDYQNTAAQIAYSGTWATVTQTGASGGSVNQTTDNSAVANFTVKGSNVQIAYTQGPLQGDAEVWVDGVLNAYLLGRAAKTTPNTLATIYLGGAGIHLVAVKRNVAGAAGAITLDRVRVLNNQVGTVATALTDDRDYARIYYFGAWSTATLPGANANTVTYSSTSGAYISLLARGSAITLYHSVGPAYGSATIYVDNVVYGTMYSDGSVQTPKVPYVISGLAPIDHTIRIVLNAASYLEFDAVQPSSPAALAAKVDERVSTVLYSGVWNNFALLGAYVNGTRWSVDPNATVEFQFTGNILCLGYLQEGGGADYYIYVDGLYVDTISSNGSLLLKSWCSHTSPTATPGHQVFYTGLHKVTIYRGTSGFIELDYIQPMTYNLLTPARGMVQENDAAISYSGTWATATSATFGPTTASPGFIPTGAKSLGGYLPSGGALRRTQGDGPTATFFINGTGFILYSSIGAYQGCAQIYVDGSLYQFNDGGVLDNGIYLDLTGQGAIGRYRPFSFGISNLPAGIHKIQAVSNSSCSSFGFSYPTIYYFDFDAVRVFP